MFIVGWLATIPITRIGELNLRASSDPTYHKQVTRYALVGGEVYVRGMTDETAIDVARRNGAIEEEFFLV